MATIAGKIKKVASAESKLAGEVRSALVETLYASPFSLFIGALAGSIVAASIAWDAGSMSLLICSIIIHIVGIMRVVSAYAFDRVRKSASGLLRQSWEMFYEIGAWLYASLIGVLAFLSITQLGITIASMMAVTMATCYGGGVAVRNAGRPVIAIGQLTLSTLPVSIALAMRGQMLESILSVTIVFFIIGMIDIAAQTYEIVYAALSGQQEKTEVADRFEKLAQSDMLTGLDNRLAMQTRLGDLLEELDTDAHKNLAIMWFDLDQFKGINDTLGHLAGDKVLIVTSQRVKALLGNRGWLARFGGDEFVVMAKVDSHDEAVALGEEIQDSIMQPVSVNDTSIKITASTGIAIAPAHGKQTETLLKNADIALYHAKNNGGRAVCLFEPIMQDDFLLHKQIEAGLQNAIKNDEFTLLFQPIVDLETGLTKSCEALLRWDSSELGNVSPSTFIPVAESAGLIAEITEWVLNKACEAAAQWPEHVNVSVNISPALLKDTNLPVTIIETLVNTNMAARRLELEITKSVLLDKSSQTNSLLRQLQKLGLRLSLDDFGTGFSSLTYLRSWEFDTIKIDKSFTSNITQSQTDQKIIKAVVQLARSLQVITVAEGVEDEEQLAEVRRAGCSHAQGYLYAKPTTVDVVTPKLKQEVPTPDTGAPDRVVKLR